MTIRTTEVKIAIFKAHIASQRRPGTPPTIWEREASSVELASAKKMLMGMWHKSPESEGEYFLRVPGMTEGIYITMNQIIASEQLERGEKKEFPLEDMPVKRKLNA